MVQIGLTWNQVAAQFEIPAKLTLPVLSLPFLTPSILTSLKEMAINYLHGEKTLPSV